MSRILTIPRDVSDSPNMAANDAAILECIAEELRSLGAEVVGYDGNMPEGTDIVCHMSRTPAILQMLEKAESSGTRVINTPNAVNNCSRNSMIRAMEHTSVPQPAFKVVIEAEELEELPYPAWIKRGEGWSCHKDDVCYAADAGEARQAFERMQERGITNCIHCGHIEGDLIKFYAVGEDFFSYCYPDPEKSKFGLERINGAPSRYPFDLERMKEIVHSAAKATGLEIYGGDCIVDSKGGIFIIDLNDFPSFTAVRHEAAERIAQYIMNIKNKRKDDRR